MTAEDTPTPSPAPEPTHAVPDDGLAADDRVWLAGLQGRAGQGPSHAEGALLREALVGDAPAQGFPPAPPWAAIVTRAEAMAAAEAVGGADGPSGLTSPSSAATPAMLAGHPPGPAGAAAVAPAATGPVGAGRPPEANGPWSGRGVRWAWGLAAAVFMIFIVPGLVYDPSAGPAHDRDGAVLRGASTTGLPRWRTAHPIEDAQALAEELRGMGGVVDIQPARTGSGVVMKIHAGPAAYQAVSGRLLPLELALDLEGSVAVSVEVR